MAVTAGGRGAAGPPPGRARDPPAHHRGAPVIRRPLWLVAGAALGAGGTVWTRRRLEQLSRRVRPASVAGDVASMVGRTRRGTADRVRDAVDAGRAGARRREDDLWRDFLPDRFDDASDDRHGADRGDGPRVREAAGWHEPTGVRRGADRPAAARAAKDRTTRERVERARAVRGRSARGAGPRPGSDDRPSR